MTIKRAREIVKLTQQQLSEWLSIPKRTIESWDMESREPATWVKRLLIEKILSNEADGNRTLYVVEEFNIRKNGEIGDGFDKYFGFDFSKALETYENLKSDYERLSEEEKRNETFELQVYRIPNDIDLEDENEIINAMCDSTGYDTIDF